MTENAPAGVAPLLAARIAAGGPVTIAEYMDCCLCDPLHGYYMRRDPLGAAGDFTTSPEICQIFGELIGLWCAQVWRSMGSPSPVLLTELGPGRGTLMSDALRAAKTVPGFAEAIRPVLVETSPALTQIQRTTLSPFDASWHLLLDSVPRGAMIVIANEFLDALPIRQFQYRDGEWQERCVTMTPEDKFAPVQKPVSRDEIPAFASGHKCADGEILEYCPAASALAASLGERAASHPLAALFIDYGHDMSAFGDTLQAMRAHKPVDPFEAPGMADLTAHVDFGAFAGSARAAGLAVYGPMSQGRFLMALGLAQRAQRLIAGARDKDSARLLESGARRLADPAQMGELFRVISIAGPDVPLPPAFEGNE